MRIFVPVVLAAALALAGCGAVSPDDGSAQRAGPDTARPQARPGAAADPVATAAAQPGAGAFLGTERATLGDPAEPGLWLSTRHVTQPIAGQVVVPDTGRSAQVALRPSGGAGGRLSLAAMQALGLPLTDLREVEVYAAE